MCPETALLWCKWIVIAEGVVLLWRAYHKWINQLCMYVCMYVCMLHACIMYVCMYVCMYIKCHVHIHTPGWVQMLMQPESAHTSNGELRMCVCVKELMEPL